MATKNTKNTKTNPSPLLLFVFLVFFVANPSKAFRSAPDSQPSLPLPECVARWIDDAVDTLIAFGWAHQAFAQARVLEPNYPNLPHSAGHP